jgi:hypothetical protein
MAYNYNPTIGYTNVYSTSGNILNFFSLGGFSASATGTWDPNGGLAPTLNDVRPNWYVNGNGVSNSIVQSISGQGTDFIAVQINLSSALPGSVYTFAPTKYAVPFNTTPTVGPAAFLSTNLNNRIQSYDMLAERIFFQLGAPLINLEIACIAVYDMIAYAIEQFTRFTPGTEELLIFDSALYTKGQGIKLDTLINNTPETASLTSTFQSGWDYDMNDYRKIIDIYNFQEGSNEGVNTLFTIEQSLAQQMHFAYSLGSKAFDLITWHVLKDWLKTREKLFAMKQYVRFDPRTQVLRITPEPNLDLGKRYYGCVGVYLERPIKDLVKERWVMEYAKALIKISIANTRGKFGGTQLFGSGTIQYQELMNQGREEKKALEDELKGGFSEVQQPPMFFLG